MSRGKVAYDFTHGWKMKFNVVVRKFIFAQHSPDPSLNEETNKALVEASNGKQQYLVDCGKEIYAPGYKARLEFRSGQEPRLVER